MKRVLVAAVVAAFFVSMAGCFLLQPSGCPFGCPEPEPVETPAPQIPTATPAPLVAPATKGRATLVFSGVEGLRFGYPEWTPGALDYWVLATLGESGSSSLPILEISLRGNTTEPCQARPCNARTEHPECDPSSGAYWRGNRCYTSQKAGLWLRYSGNLAYESGGDFGGCGLVEPFEYGQRIPLGPDGLASPFLVELEWSPSGVRARAGGAWSPLLHLKQPGSIRLGTASFEVPPGPRGQGLGFARPSWSAHLRGVAGAVQAWEALEDSPSPPRCP